MFYYNVATRRNDSFSAVKKMIAYRNGIISFQQMFKFERKSRRKQYKRKYKDKRC